MGLAGGSAPSTPDDPEEGKCPIPVSGNRRSGAAWCRRECLRGRLASWGAKAAAAGVSSSALLRQAMARTGVWTPTAADVERERGREVERERTRELARIGNNLNQIARWANQHKSAADAVEVSRHLAAIELALRDLARRS